MHQQKRRYGDEIAKRYLLPKDVRNIMAHAGEAERQDTRDMLSNPDKLEILIKAVLQDVTVVVDV